MTLGEALQQVFSGAIVLAVGVWWLLKYNQRTKQESKTIKANKAISRDRFAGLCSGTKYAPRPELCSEREGLYIAVSANPPAVLVSVRDDRFAYQDFELDAEEILSVAFTIDDKAVYSAGPVPTLAAAAAGGALMGGAAAVVGALSAGRVGAGKLNRATLDIRLNDLKRSSVSIPFLTSAAKASDKHVQVRLKLAEQWLHVIEVLRVKALERHQARQMMPKEPASPTATKESRRAVADEVLKLATLKDSGHLTEEEFSALKAELIRSAKKTPVQTEKGP